MYIIASVTVFFSPAYRTYCQQKKKLGWLGTRQIYIIPLHDDSLCRLLEDKRKELGDAASKLSNGLSKLIDTRQKVEAMTVELEETRAQLAIFQKQCDEYLVVIVQQKREAEEQEKTVTVRSEKIAEEETKCRQLAAVAQKDLDEALPALEEAIKVRGRTGDARC